MCVWCIISRQADMQRMLERSTQDHMDKRIPLRITLVNPPKGVQFCLQKGKDELVDVVLSTGKNIEFSLGLRVRENAKTGSPNFLGEFVQGTAEQRFFYICVGKYAGQENTEWARRVKIHVSTITWKQIHSLLANPKKTLLAGYEATLPDGSPSCASVQLIDGGWRVG
jgi:hypothetical protein